MSTNFWDDEDGNEIEQKQEFEIAGGKFETIPAKTQCLALIEYIGWEQFEDAGETEYIEVTWSLLKPDCYANRKVPQKIQVCGKDQNRDDYDESKTSKVIKNAKGMLAAIDGLAGGKLFALKKKPTDNDLQKALLNKPMLITLQVWETKNKFGEDITGNWVSKVESAKGAQLTNPKKTEKPVPDSDNDDIPF